MEIGSLEYVVIGCKDDHFTNEILPELNTIQASDLIRVVDLLFVSKAAEGTVTTREVSDLSEEEQQPFEGMTEDLGGLFTTQDVENLATAIPSGTQAVVVLLEHTWTLGLTDGVRRAGGVLFTGGLITPEALAQVSAELAAKEEKHA
jgi:hypothetical protein